jgi:hypothetical protein
VSGLSIKDGAEVECGGRRFVIMQRIGFDFVVARDIETDDLVRADSVHTFERLANVTICTALSQIQPGNRITLRR